MTATKAIAGRISVSFQSAGRYLGNGMQSETCELVI
jgi:hypothetical protein